MCSICTLLSWLVHRMFIYLFTCWRQSSVNIGYPKCMLIQHIQSSYFGGHRLKKTAPDFFGHRLFVKKLLPEIREDSFCPKIPPQTLRGHTRLAKLRPRYSGGIQVKSVTDHIGDSWIGDISNRWQVNSVTSQFGDNITRWQVISVTKFNSNVIKCSHRPIVYDSSTVSGTCPWRLITAIGRETTQ